MIDSMKTWQSRTAITALATAGALWGLTVPLSKLSLAWLGPGWLTVARFAVAAPLLAILGRRRLREAMSLGVASAGAVGFGAVIVLQNLGIEHTSVSHAALVVGAVPVLVALVGAGLGAGATRPLAWGGYALALVGIGLTAGSGGNGASATGDLLVLGSAVLTAAVIVVQPRLLAGRDPAAVTAVQFLAGAVVSLPVAMIMDPSPTAPATLTPALAFVALSAVGTLLPFWLFALGQSRVPAELAGAFVNLEPVVGAAVGWLAFGNTAAVAQVLGAGAVLSGIALSTVSPRRRGNRRRTDPESGRAPRGELPRRRRSDPHRRAESCPDFPATGPTAGIPRRFPRGAPGLHRGRLRHREAPVVGGADPTDDPVRLGSPPDGIRRAPGSDPPSPRAF